MSRIGGYDVKDMNLHFRNKARRIIDDMDNVEDRPNVYNQVSIPPPKELLPNYLSNPANRGLDNKDINLNFLNTERYRKANSSFYNTGFVETNNGFTAKRYFDKRLMF